jgi:serine/threonine protein phosphatase PrpC
MTSSAETPAPAHDAPPPDEDATQPLDPAHAGAEPAALRRAGVIAAARRDIGQVREINQDHVFALTASMPREEQDVVIGLYIVADGMGGHDGGEVASQLAVAEIVRHVLAELLIPALGSGINASIQAIITSAVQGANRAIYDHGRSLGSDMGTTCTVALLLGHSLYIGHVGDTRAYLFGPSGIRRLTSDHSAVGRLIELGQLDPSEAREHPLRSHLYRTVGQTPEVVVDVSFERLGDATHLLLASDGLWGMVEDDDLAAIVQTASPEEACVQLIRRANDAGGDDNISAVVVAFPATQSEDDGVL